MIAHVHDVFRDNVQGVLVFRESSAEWVGFYVPGCACGTVFVPGSERETARQVAAATGTPFPAIVAPAGSPGQFALRSGLNVLNGNTTKGGYALAVSEYTDAVVFLHRHEVELQNTTYVLGFNIRLAFILGISDIDTEKTVLDRQRSLFSVAVHFWRKRGGAS